MKLNLLGPRGEIVGTTDVSRVCWRLDSADRFVNIEPITVKITKRETNVHRFVFVGEDGVPRTYGVFVEPIHASAATVIFRAGDIHIEVTP